MELTKAELYILRDGLDLHVEFSSTGVPEEDAPAISLQKRIQDELAKLESCDGRQGT